MATTQAELRAHLEEVRAQFGVLTPETVVQAARPRNHPLHGRVFDRAPKDAAEAWYKHRAHELIQSVRVVYRDATDAERDVRAFIAVPRPNSPQPGYEPVEDVIMDDFKRKLMLQEAERAWRNLHARYGSLIEFSEMVLRDVRGETA